MTNFLTTLSLYFSYGALNTEIPGGGVESSPTPNLKNKNSPTGIWLIGILSLGKSQINVFLVVKAGKWSN